MNGLSISGPSAVAHFFLQERGVEEEGKGEGERGKDHIEPLHIFLRWGAMVKGQSLNLNIEAEACSH